MIKRLLPVEDLPKRSATYAKTKWPYLKRTVRSAGCVAMTSRGKVQVVAMDPVLYQEIAALAAATRKVRV